MAYELKTTQAGGLLDTMTALELYETIEYATKVRKSRPCPFLELSPELRNHIYRLRIRPRDVRKHATNKEKAPVLLKGNRQIRSEFAWPPAPKFKQ